MKVHRTLTLIASVFVVTSAIATAQDFKFVQFDIPHSSRTNLFAVNDFMVLTGTFRTGAPDGPRHGFIAGPHIFKVIDDGDFPAGTTAPQGINNRNVVVGAIQSDGTLNSIGIHGFIYDDGKFTTLDFPGATRTEAFNINDFGVVTGDYTDSSSVTHGFTYRNGTFTTVDNPGAISSFVYGVNDAGVLTIQYVGTDNRNHSTILAHGKFLAADVPAATDSFIHGVNLFGAAAYSYTDATGVFHGALRTPSGSFAKFDAPGATNGTFGDGVNDFGVVVGVFRDATTAHGFIALPKEDDE